MTHRKQGPDGVSWALPWVGGVFSFSPGTKQGAGRCRVLSTLSYLRGTTYPLAGGEEALPDGSAQRWPLPLARPRSRDAGLGASGRIRFLPRVPLAACAWPVPALLCACFPEGPHMGLCDQMASAQPDLLGPVPQLWGPGPTAGSPGAQREAS